MYKFLLLLFPLIFVMSCGPDGMNSDDDDPPVNFDRGAMLANWMDNVIIPAAEAHVNRLGALEQALTAVQDNTGDLAGTELDAIQLAFDESYLAYQRMSPFIFSEGEAIRLRERTNTYPTDESLIQANVSERTNLELPSNTTAQGYPALEFLLYGTDRSTPMIFDNADARSYALELVTVLVGLHNDHVTALEENRDAFVANDGNAATASIDRSVNDFIFFYEKFLRAGKVGIPAGVFSDDPLADRVESLYKGQSKTLFLEALQVTADFFEKEGLAAYLDALNETRDGEPLSALINEQFNRTISLAATVDEDFNQQVLTDNSKMLALYDELQKNTILLKVDMLQALSINVDFVDADGD